MYCRNFMLGWSDGLATEFCEDLINFTSGKEMKYPVDRNIGY